MPRIACSGLFSSWATPETSRPTAARRSWRTTWRCSDCSISRILRSCSTWRSSASRASRRLAAIVMKASCSSAISRFGDGARAGGERSPSAIRCAALRSRCRPRAGVRRHPERQRQHGEHRRNADREVSPPQRREPIARPRCAGCRRSADHGPRSSDGVPTNRSTPSTSTLSCGAGLLVAGRRARDRASR